MPPFRGVSVVISRPLSHGGHVESQENKKLCFCTASLALNSRLAEGCRAKTKLFIPSRFNMATEDQGRVVRKPINANPRLDFNRGYQLAR